MPALNARLATLALLLLAGVSGCATLPEHPPLPPPSHAIPPQPGGALADVESGLGAKLEVAESGWHLLDSNEEALRWRIAVVDAAEHSLDIQSYFWWEDETGDLLMKHVVDAADRGVRVRIILDDITTVLKDHRHLKMRDWQTSVLNAHKNIELRLFNAFRVRSLLGRAFEFMRRMELLNQRMHNKLLVADNRAAILGGRNVGNEYFGFAEEFNFRDIDVLGVGPIARQTSIGFDRFWNSEWVVQVSALNMKATTQDLDDAKPGVLAKIEGSPVLERLPLNRADWKQPLTKLAAGMHAGPSRVLTDVPASGEVHHRMPAAMRRLMESARKELLIINSYVIPDQEEIDFLKSLTGRGVKVRFLTNSLASQDVPAVNSHYKSWRKPLIAAGVELYETRPDAAIQALVADTPPVKAKSMGLHVKAIAVDRARVFIGSMNLDPRSEELNSEMGVVIESVPLAQQLAGIMERDTQPENAWRVTTSPKGRLRWTAGTEVLTRQPARGTWQRMQDVFFMAFPRRLY